jgi:hypothetical protein
MPPFLQDYMDITSQDSARVYIADLLAAIAWQQNGGLGYTNMVLTMAATLNSVDAVNAIPSGGSVTRQLEKDQSVLRASHNL